MKGVIISNYKNIFRIILILFIFIYVLKHYPLYFFSVFTLIYAHIIFVKGKNSIVKRFIRAFKNYMVYLKNRLRNKLKKI